MSYRYFKQYALQFCNPVAWDEIAVFIILQHCLGGVLGLISAMCERFQQALDALPPNLFRGSRSVSPPIVASSGELS